MDLAEGHVAAIQLLEEAQGSKEVKEDKEEVKKGGERNANVPVAYAGTVSTVNLGTGSGASVLEMVAAMETACECKVQFVQIHQHKDIASTEVNACVHTHIYIYTRVAFFFSSIFNCDIFIFGMLPGCLPGSSSAARRLIHGLCRDRESL